VCDLIFADNDILLKLAEYDLLQEACAALSTTPANIRFQPATKHVVLHMRDKAVKGKESPYSQRAFDRAIAFVESASYLTDRPNIDWAEGSEGIDFGEAQLASWAVEAGDDSLLLTGDKRFMKALSGSPAAKHIFRGLHGRVVCLEEILRAIMLTDGVDCVRKAVKHAPKCDQAMSFVFGSHFDLPDEHVWDGIDNLLREITAIVGDGWLKRIA
jgi:hypothetical protein